jgi:hypothetical protein
MTKKTRTPKATITAEEYIKQRDFLVSNLESGNLPEEEFNKKIQVLYAKRLPVYRNGGDGFIAWAEENVCVDAYIPGTSIKKPTYLSDLSREPEPETGKTWWDLWCWQRSEIKKALVLREDGRLKHNLVVFCTERGEGKSFMAVLIVLWKFCCLAGQRIFLAANSKEQSSFAHREEIDKIVRISPVLLGLIGGEKAIKQRELAIYDSKGRKISFITTVSTFTGVLSNATGFTFSEFFASPPDGRFFSEIYGSMRNTPNALGVIDSTVSTRDHRLYRIYENIQKGLPGTETQYFLFKSNPGAKIENYYSPANTQSQLDAFRTTFTPGEFQMFFENTWDSATSGLFSDTDIEIADVLGMNGAMLNHEEIKEVVEACKQKESIPDRIQGSDMGVTADYEAIAEMKRPFVPVSRYLSNIDEHNFYIPTEELEELGNILDTDWCIGIGVDRADTIKTTTGAQSALVCVAKGLPGSRSNPYLYLVDGGEGKSPDYIYIPVGVYVTDFGAANEIQAIIQEWHSQYNGIEGFAADKFGMQDLPGWLIEQELIDKPEVLQFSYNVQRAVMMMLFNALKRGRFKKPNINIPGVRGSDILVEQMKHYVHRSVNGTRFEFSSDEKGKKGGVQDDTLEALALAIYSVRMKGLDSFKSIRAKSFFGEYVPPSN